MTMSSTRRILRRTATTTTTATTTPTTITHDYKQPPILPENEVIFYYPDDPAEAQPAGVDSDQPPLVAAPTGVDPPPLFDVVDDEIIFADKGMFLVIRSRTVPRQVVAVLQGVVPVAASTTVIYRSIIFVIISRERLLLTKFFSTMRIT